MSKVYNFKRMQVLPISLAEAWDFFSSPENLAGITPKSLRFKITSIHHGKKMYPGQIIEYIVKPFLGISFYWLTEITHVEVQSFFIDEQRFGPYSFWHHQHHFIEIENGVQMTDIIHYKLRLWFLGDIVNALFVKSQLKKIFDFRYKKVAELFKEST